jgi:Zn-dependent protease
MRTAAGDPFHGGEIDELGYNERRDTQQERRNMGSTGTGIPLGRIFGIRLVIDWSWIFIFLLVTWNLAAGVIEPSQPGWGDGFAIVLAVIASLLFFASILAHELAHSLVARRFGLPIRDITLNLFGGVSTIQREPPSPRAEFLIAIVGPLTSIVLGLIFLLLGGLSLNAVQHPTTTLSRLNPISALLLWLGPINILVGLFNLIPGFPLDGGRVLRSIIWAATGNLRRATHWASWVGQAIAIVFIVTGIAMAFGTRVPVFGTGVVGGLWLAFIGLFLNNASVQSYQQVVIQDLLTNVPVAALMHRPVPTVQSNAPIASLVHDHLMGTDDHAFPVLEGDRLVGIVCLHDVRKVPKEAWNTTPVSAVMTPGSRLAVTSPRDDARSALETLEARGVNQLPVVENGQVVGMLRRRDILTWLQQHGKSSQQQYRRAA